jgi:O-acetylhomoserine (thiol)-lyase
MPKARRLKQQTSLLHTSYNKGPDYFASREPLNVSTAFAYKDAEKLAAAFTGEEHGFLYSRIHNPTVAQFEKAMVVLEGGIGALACASGMAAITCAVLAFVTAGDTVLSSSSLFGGTFSLLTKTLQRLGVKVKFFDPTDPDSIERLMDETTKVVFTEIIGNPKMDVAQVDRIAQAAHKAAIPLIVDNTLAPCIFRGAAHGADLIVHSTSKYVDGQGRVIGGCLIDTGSSGWDRAKYEYLQDYTTQFGQEGLLTFIRYELMSNLGCCFSPYHADLHLAGLETLPLRMERHCHNALELAQFLRNQRMWKILSGILKGRWRDEPEGIRVTGFRMPGARC